MKMTPCFLSLLGLVGWVAFSVGVFAWIRSLQKRIQEVESKFSERSKTAEHATHCSYTPPNSPTGGRERRLNAVPDATCSDSTARIHQ